MSRTRVLPFLRSLLVIGLIGVASALVVVRLRTDDATAPAVPQGVPADEVVHLHGIALNPPDGQLYLATHTGVLTVGPDGDIERIADRYQDTMGFTVLGADLFLGSGHPDLREDAPRSLGLIRSEDAAETWEPVSLSGEADLHSIVAAHGRVYAADATAGRLLVSVDEGRTWERRGAVELAALAVDPRDPEVLVGADYEGALQRSADGGRTWQRPDGPRISAVAWDEQVGLLGASPEGEVFASGDGGTSWVRRGNLEGSGPVLTVFDGAAWAATDGARFLRSDDGGRTWAVTAEPSG